MQHDELKATKLIIAQNFLYILDSEFKVEERNYAKRIKDTLGFSRSNINNWKKGSIPTTEHIAHTCRILNYRIDWVLTGKGEKKISKYDSIVETPTKKLWEDIYIDYLSKLENTPRIPYNDNLLIKNPVPEDILLVTTTERFVFEALGDNLEELISSKLDAILAPDYTFKDVVASSSEGTLLLLLNAEHEVWVDLKIKQYYYTFMLSSIENNNQLLFDSGAIEKFQATIDYLKKIMNQGKIPSIIDEIVNKINEKEKSIDTILDLIYKQVLHAKTTEKNQKG